MCLYSLPWLAVFAIADGGFALGILILSLIMKGPIWTSVWTSADWTGKAWFVSAAVLGAVLYLVSIALIVKFWNQAPGTFVRCGGYIRCVALISVSVIVEPLGSALFPKEKDKCVDFCSSLGLRFLILAVIIFLYFGMFWPTFQAAARAWELEKGTRLTCWQLFYWGFTDNVPVVPAPAPPPFSHPSAQSNVNANAHMAPVSPSNDVERWESASATREN